MERELERIYVIGIDPGTTTAYAILNFNGEIIEKRSSKNLGLEKMIKEISKYKNIVLIAVDRKNINENLIRNLSSRLGIGVFFPDHDLTKEEKKMIHEKMEENDHIYDSIVAAKYAIKKNKKKVIRAIRFLKAKNRLDILIKSLKIMFKEKNVNAAAVYEIIKNEEEFEKQKKEESTNPTEKKKEERRVIIYPLKVKKVKKKRIKIRKSYPGILKEFIILLNYSIREKAIIPTYKGKKLTKEAKGIFSNDIEEIKKFLEENKKGKVFFSNPYLINEINKYERGEFYLIPERDIEYLGKYFVVLKEGFVAREVTKKKHKKEVTEEEIRRAYETVKKLLWEHRKMTLPP